MKSRIAIQGVLGSFHHQVAIEYFGDSTELLECMSFDAVVQGLLQNQVEDGVMAIENSIAGTIIPNYALIDRNELIITGEHYVKINHNLMALPGQSIEDIKEVHSHPMALLQCAVFFSQYPHIRLVESVDTAETAKRIREQNIKGLGAIASDTAAAMYDLTILASGIHTIQSNYTRFVIVSTKEHAPTPTEVNKASIKFVLDDMPGSLATLLNVLNNCKLNLTKIQSLPVIETPFKYSFFVDVVFEKYKHFEKAKKIIAIMASEFKVLGEYKNKQL
jgi:prephenate dehydratase